VTEAYSPYKTLNPATVGMIIVTRLKGDDVHILISIIHD